MQDVGGGAQTLLQVIGDPAHDVPIEPDAGHEQEVAPAACPGRRLGEAEVDAPPLALAHHPDGLERVTRYPHLLGPDVGGAAADHGQRGVGQGEAVGHLVDRPVAAAGDNGIESLPRGLTGQISGVPLLLRRRQLGLPAPALQPGKRLPQLLHRGRASGDRIDDEQGSLAHFAGSRKAECTTLRS